MYQPFSNDEIIEIFKKWKLKTYRILIYSMIGVFIFILLEAIIITTFIPEETRMIMFWLIPFSCIFLLIAYITFLNMLKIQAEPNRIKEVKYFNEYETEYVKIPLIKRVYRNRNNHEIAVIMMIEDEAIRFMYLNRQHTIFMNLNRRNTIFNFYYKIKNNQEVHNNKIIIKYEQKKYRFIMMTDTSYQIFNYIKTHGIQYNINEKQK